MSDLIYHRAKLVTKDGNVSPLCAETPKALDLRKEKWTIRDDAVTCVKCLQKLATAKPANQ